MWLQGHQACAHCHLLRGQRRGQAGPSGSSGSHRHSVTLLGLSVIVCPFYGGLRQGWTQRGHSQGGGGRGLSCRPPQLRELRGARIQSLCTFSTVKALSSDSPLGPLWCPQTPDPASQPGENPAAGVQGTCMHAHPGGSALSVLGPHHTLGSKQGTARKVGAGDHRRESGFSAASDPKASPQSTGAIWLHHKNHNLLTF